MDHFAANAARDSLALTSIAILRARDFGSALDEVAFFAGVLAWRFTFLSAVFALANGEDAVFVTAILGADGSAIDILATAFFAATDFGSVARLTFNVPPVPVFEDENVFPRAAAFTDVDEVDITLGVDPLFAGAVAPAIGGALNLPDDDLAAAVAAAEGFVARDFAADLVAAGLVPFCVLDFTAVGPTLAPAFLLATFAPAALDATAVRAVGFFAADVDRLAADFDFCAITTPHLKKTISIYQLNLKDQNRKGM